MDDTAKKHSSTAPPVRRQPLLEKVWSYRPASSSATARATVGEVEHAKSLTAERDIRAKTPGRVADGAPAKRRLHDYIK